MAGELRVLPLRALHIDAVLHRQHVRRVGAPVIFMLEASMAIVMGFPSKLDSGLVSNLFT